ncbi:type VII secretion protein EssC [Pseudobutyrivibrio xylanivorans]|uniref:Type VII secretion protein EssC n=1 Tax=Pseudobutyrivibrio xylanivorans TaxID=185007 RepID=A0A5P6VPX0_PSEXY|nr:type VII secretion protein EssC [Pseudobutyrivibrio xylanivorans]QFJ53729.1 type VII secretion protein EssC [Pseudobutyrivibrio xylanivorans]
MKYKITIYNSKIYKEIVVEDDFKGLLIGTERNCQVHLLKEDFDRDFVFELKNNAGTLELSSKCDITFSEEDGLAGPTAVLRIGSLCHAAFTEDGKELLNLECTVDFDTVPDNYNLVINLAGQNTVSIGGSKDCTIRFFDRELRDGYVVLNRTNGGFSVDDTHLEYGASINGILHKDSSELLKDKDFLGVYGYSFYLDNNLLYTSDKTGIATNLGNQLIEANNIHFHYPQYIRSVRQNYIVSEDKIDILPPKAKQKDDQKNLFMILLPTIMMLCVMIGVRGLLMGSNIAMMLMFVATGIISGITAVINYFQDKKKRKEKEEERINYYNDYIGRKENEIIKARNDEKTIMLRMNRSVEDTMNSIQQFDGNLFSHGKEQEDFLDVWIGTGLVESKEPVEFKEQEYIDVEDAMMDIPEQIANKYKYIDGMPISLHLREANAVGFVAERTKLYQLMKNMMVTIAGEYFYKEVKMFLIIGENDVPDFAWARWFKNMSADNGGMRYFMYDDESSKRALEFLYNELSARDQMKADQIENLPTFVVFIYRSERIRRHPVMDYVEKAAKLGFVFLFWEEQAELLNRYCSQLVFLESGSYKGYIQDAKDGKNIQTFNYPHISREDVQRLALRLGCVYIDEMSLEGTLTKHISLYQLLGIMNAYDLKLDERWNNSQIYKSMAAPLGVRSNGEIVYLDIHEKFHGPHGLVAGTTGSGKSEIIQTYILSLATLFHPYEVGFIIIDFKGGGMANQFKDLPHLNGTITNIDGKQIDRSLRSIKAELLRRQALFAEHNVNKIDDYISLFKKGETETPLPHLILIVDEFAELKSEQPEFMKELISAARIGRSLGVHLILATQKPAGVVNDQIWSNSKFKLCLKVQDKQDSNEVLKSPLAAEIREPGRAYLQVGNNEIFELFQSAYSGDPAVVSSTENSKKFEINGVDLSGKRTTLYKQKAEKSKGGQNQLEAIVDRINEYCQEHSIAKLQDICLPPLAEVIDFPATEQLGTQGTDIIADMGIYDDPDSQYQGAHTINLTRENVIVIGSSQSGKTNLLQTIIRSITTKYTPDEVNIYILDFASMVLKNFEGLNHVGGVVTSSEDEKLKNLFKLLYSEIEMRKEKLLAVGVSSFAAYREAGKTDLPQIVLMVDNYTALKETYFTENDDLLVLCREGLTVGVTVVLANAQTAGMGYKYFSNFSCRVALFCNDTNEYSSLFEHCRERIEDISGRAIIDVNKKHLDCQTYLAFQGQKEIERVQAIRQFIEERNAQCPDQMARPIPVIPAVLPANQVSAMYSRFLKRRFELVVGLNYANVDPFIVDFGNIGALGITGKEGRGRHNFINYVVKMLDKQYPEMTEVHIIDGIDKRLADLKDAVNVASYAMTSDAAVALMGEVEQKLQARYDALAMGDETVLTDSKLILIVINSQDAIEAISGNATAVASYKNIITKYKSMGAAVLVGGFGNETIPYAAPEILKRIKEQKHFMFFDDLPNCKVTEIPLTAARAFKKKIEAGDGYYLKDNAIVKLKTPLWNE